VRIRGVGSHENPISFYLVASLYMAFTRLMLRTAVALSAAQRRHRLLARADVVPHHVPRGPRSGSAPSALYAAFTMRSPRVLLATVATAAVLLGVFAVPVVIERTFGFSASPGAARPARSPMALYESINWQGRELAWPIVFAAFLTQPWTGLGLGSSILIMRQYFPPEVGPLVHNDYLRVAVETGVIGMVLFTGAMMLHGS
jgi:hypothetical protein